MEDLLFKILDYLVKYRLDTVVVSIIFSLILARIYFKFHHFKSLDDLLKNKELEVVKSYEAKLNRLNTELNATKDKVNDLKEQLLQAKRIEGELKDRNNDLLFQLMSKNSEVSSLEMKNYLELFKIQLDNFSRQQNIKTYEKE